MPISHPRVFGWLADRQGCGWYRIMLPLAELQRRGIDTAFDQAMPDHVRSLDGPPVTVVGQRVCLAGPSTTWQALAKSPRHTLVFEVDDDLLHCDPANETAASFFGRPDIRAALESNLRVADLVTVSTEPLAEAMRAYNENVIVLPNMIDAAVFDLERPEHDGLVLGWAGSPTHGGDFDVVGRYLRRYFRAHPEIWWHSVGTDYRRETGAVRHCFTKWTDLAKEGVNAYYRRLAFDVGIAPLADTAFNAGKSAIKTLEYAALGIPAVASAVGPYPGFVRDGETGILVRRAGHWPDALASLTTDGPLRRKMGEAARELAARWTIQEHGGLWADAYGVTP